MPTRRRRGSGEPIKIGPRSALAIRLAGFAPGQRMRLTAKAREQGFKRADGRLVGMGRTGAYRIQQDGNCVAVTYHRSFWEPIPEEEN
jgi:hypothetical protein